MSLEKEVKKHTPADWKGLKGSGGNFSFFQKVIDPYIDSLSILDNPIGEVTSRDQIINPHELIDATLYQNTRQGKARYNQDLERAKLYAQQQEAAYKEWYESSEQAAIRERQAGRNPDLLDSLDSQAASTEMPEGGALDDIPTNGQMALDALSSVSNLFSTVAQLASLPFSIGAARATSTLAKEQSDGQLLSNLNAFESLVYGNASGRLSDAISASAVADKSFDFDAWFNNAENFSGIFEAYAPQDNSHYRAAYSRAIKNVQKLKGSAFATSTEASRNQTNFAQLLSNPYTDPDLLIQVALMEPLMKAVTQYQELVADYNLKYQSLLDAQSAANSVNAENTYKTNYFLNVASQEDLIRVGNMALDNIRKSAEAAVFGNLLDTYKQNPTSSAGIASGALIMGASHFDASEWLMLSLPNFVSNFDSSVDGGLLLNPDPNSIFGSKGPVRNVTKGILPSLLGF